jgi:diguanylate cyclase (GGDEF)-like protein
VLELINRLDGKTFTQRDMTLLEIFAGYTSFMLQNALDAKRAHELAKRDDLTGLFNDRWFNVRLSEAITDARKTTRDLVLIFLDLDRFKYINDAYGHLAGSQVLREVGFILKRLVQSASATVARYGGDEFVIVLPETSLEDGTALCEQIRAGIAGTTFLEREWGFNNPALNLSGILSASIGIAEYANSGDGATEEHEKSELLRRADAAMYRAKSAGKNQVVVSRAGDAIDGAPGGEFSERALS